MKYKSRSIPGPSVGLVFTDKKSVLPNQSLSLQEILERFTRGEPLEIGREGATYDDGPEDLEKLSHMDLVDRAEYINKLKQTSKTWEKQEKRKAEKEKERLDKLAVEKLAADKKAAEKSADNAK